MKNMKRILAIALVVVSVLTLSAPALALSGGYNAATVYLSTRTMKMDDLNNDPIAVKNLQFMLQAQGINPGPIDGIYGQLTYNAVMAFQNRYFDLTDDGICGKYTKIKLWEQLPSIPSGCQPVQE